MFGILDIHAAKRHVAAAKLGAIAMGVGGMPPPPKKIFENGAILCVLRAIFNDFHDEKSSQKL